MIRECKANCLPPPRPPQVEEKSWAYHFEATLFNYELAHKTWKNHILTLKNIDERQGIVSK